MQVISLLGVEVICMLFRWGSGRKLPAPLLPTGAKKAPQGEIAALSELCGGHRRPPHYEKQSWPQSHLHRQGPAPSLSLLAKEVSRKSDLIRSFQLVRARDLLAQGFFMTFSPMPHLFFFIRWMQNFLLNVWITPGFGTNFSLYLGAIWGDRVWFWKLVSCSALPIRAGLQPTPQQQDAATVWRRSLFRCWTIQEQHDSFLTC